MLQQCFSFFVKNSNSQYFDQKHVLLHQLSPAEVPLLFVSPHTQTAGFLSLHTQTEEDNQSVSAGWCLAATNLLYKAICHLCQASFNEKMPE